MTASAVADWTINPDGTVTRPRTPEAWQPAADGTLTCTACYRMCQLADGEDGPCGYRGNRGGTLTLHNHGTLSALVRQVNGYGPDPFLTFKPGQPSMMIGGLQCTAACTFCMSTTIVHRPEALPGADPSVNPVAGPDSMFYGWRTPMHPRDAVISAITHGARSVLFGINEPTLSVEYTLDAARLAKQAGLDVKVETNGFSSEHVIGLLAPYVDAVDVGVKGSADPEFYARRMRSPGAVPAVLASLDLWRRHGVHVTVGDLLAPPAWQDDAQFECSARAFYARVFDMLGPCTDVLTTLIHNPGPMRPGHASAPPLLTEGNPAMAEAYAARVETAVNLARDAGLEFAHSKASDELIDCPKCGAALLEFHTGTMCQRVESAGSCLMAEHFCPMFSHTQNVTGDSRCGGCGYPVPIIVLPDTDLTKLSAYTRRQSAKAPMAPEIRADMRVGGWI